MTRDSRKQETGEAVPRFGADTIEQVMRVRDAIEAIVEEELEAALGARSSARVGEERHGYRHGTRSRTLTTSLGPATIAMPRARLEVSDGTTREWQSRVMPRYQRRTTRVDETILGLYLAGANTRRVKSALAPLLKGAPLSKDAVWFLSGGRCGTRCQRRVTNPNQPRAVGRHAARRLHSDVMPLPVSVRHGGPESRLLDFEPRRGAAPVLAPQASAGLAPSSEAWRRSPRSSGRTRPARRRASPVPPARRWAETSSFVQAGECHAGSRPPGARSRGALETQCLSFEFLSNHLR